MTMYNADETTVKLVFDQPLVYSTENYPPMHSSPLDTKIQVLEKIPVTKKKQKNNGGAYYVCVCVF